MAAGAAAAAAAAAVVIHSTKREEKDNVEGMGGRDLPPESPSSEQKGMEVGKREKGGRDPGAGEGSRDGGCEREEGAGQDLVNHTQPPRIRAHFPFSFSISSFFTQLRSLPNSPMPLSVSLGNSIPWVKIPAL